MKEIRTEIHFQLNIHLFFKLSEYIIKSIGSFLKDIIEKQCAEKILHTEQNTHGLGTHDRLSRFYVTVY